MSDPELVAISFEGVSKLFGRGGMALNEVSFTVRRGARIALLGPNGAGKTTAVRILSGAVRPTAGAVTILGARAGSAQHPQAKRRVAFVPQDPGVYRDLTVVEYLDLVRDLYGRGDPDGTISETELAVFRNVTLARLSGGFRRRLVLAGALMVDPEVLILDEPTSSFDPAAREAMHAVLGQAMSARTSVLCTHDLREAERFCDEVLVLVGGRVLLRGSLDALRSRTRPAIRVVGSQPGRALCERLTRQGFAARSDGEEAVLVEVDDLRRSAAAVVRALSSDGIDIYECTPVTVSLEQIYLDALRGRLDP